MRPTHLRCRTAGASRPFSVLLAGSLRSQRSPSKAGVVFSNLENVSKLLLAGSALGSGRYRVAVTIAPLDPVSPLSARQKERAREVAKGQRTLHLALEQN